MSEYSAQVSWERGDARFIDNRYSRAHRWRFDGGLELPASSSPLSVPLPWSDPAGVDPEEALVAALSSCHMLWFLSIAAQRRFCVERYRDLPIGTLGQNEQRQSCITVIRLRPEVEFSGSSQPTRADIESMHEAAHEQCVIAHSVTSQVRCEPVFHA